MTPFWRRLQWGNLALTALSLGMAVGMGQALGVSASRALILYGLGFWAPWAMVRLGRF